MWRARLCAPSPRALATRSAPSAPTGHRPRHCGSGCSSQGPPALRRRSLAHGAMTAVPSAWRGPQSLQLAAAGDFRGASWARWHTGTILCQGPGRRLSLSCRSLECRLLGPCSGDRQDSKRTRCLAAIAQACLGAALAATSPGTLSLARTLCQGSGGRAVLCRLLGRCTAAEGLQLRASLAAIAVPWALSALHSVCNSLLSKGFGVKPSRAPLEGNSPLIAVRQQCRALPRARDRYSPSGP